MDPNNEKTIMDDDSIRELILKDTQSSIKKRDELDDICRTLYKNGYDHELAKKMVKTCKELIIESDKAFLSLYLDFCVSKYFANQSGFVKIADVFKMEDNNDDNVDGILHNLKAKVINNLIALIYHSDLHEIFAKEGIINEETGEIYLGRIGFDEYLNTENNQDLIGLEILGKQYVMPFVDLQLLLSERDFAEDHYRIVWGKQGDKAHDTDNNNTGLFLNLYLKHLYQNYEELQINKY